MLDAIFTKVTDVPGVNVIFPLEPLRYIETPDAADIVRFPVVLPALMKVTAVPIAIAALA